MTNKHCRSVIELSVNNEFSKGENRLCLLSTWRETKQRIPLNFKLHQISRNCRDLTFLELKKKQKTKQNPRVNSEKFSLFEREKRVKNLPTYTWTGNDFWLLTSNIHSATILRMTGEMSVCTHWK